MAWWWQKWYWHYSTPLFLYYIQYTQKGAGTTKLRGAFFAWVWKLLFWGVWQFNQRKQILEVDGDGEKLARVCLSPFSPSARLITKSPVSTFLSKPPSHISILLNGIKILGWSVSSTFWMTFLHTVHSALKHDFSTGLFIFKPISPNLQADVVQKSNSLIVEIKKQQKTHFTQVPMICVLNAKICKIVCTWNQIQICQVSWGLKQKWTGCKPSRCHFGSWPPPPIQLKARFSQDTNLCSFLLQKQETCPKIYFLANPFFRNQNKLIFVCAKIDCLIHQS